MEANTSGTVVLLVEDNDDNREIYSTILRHFGYVVEEVTTGADALNEARRVRPKVILLDISLPEVDGWTVARDLKKDPVTRDIPIVALTAHALPEDHRRARELGCAAFLAKPVRPRRVLEEVERLAGAARPPGSANPT